MNKQLKGFRGRVDAKLLLEELREEYKKENRTKKLKKLVKKRINEILPVRSNPNGVYLLKKGGKNLKRAEKKN